MAAQVLDGRALEQRLKQAIAACIAAAGMTPRVAIILAGGCDASARKYAERKVKLCQEVGIAAQIHEPDVGDLLQQLTRLSQDPGVDGIVVEFPLPQPLRPIDVARILSPEKDVEGISIWNVGCLALGEKAFVPTTAAAVMHILHAYEIALRGRHAVIVGRSHVVGKPLANLMLAADATVTVCHSQTPDLALQTRQADILVAAAGSPHLIKADMVKPGAVVVDVGTNYTEAGLLGDVAYAEVAERVAWITPVPGGVGPVTTALILQNVVEAAQRRNGVAHR